MDYPKPTNSPITHGSLTHPAYLFIGDKQTLLEHTITILQNYFCRQATQRQGCRVCGVCRKVVEQQHESILWLCPEKQYGIDDLNIIFSTIAFTLESTQHFFFVLQKADHLTVICANALLKSLEEPPSGYHFILLGQRTELILPTIKSRCLIEYLHSEQNISSPAALFPFFTTITFQDPMAFAKELEHSNPTEWESLTLLDQLITYWAADYKKNLINTNATKMKQAEQMLHHLKQAMAHPPMPGSSKLFWKNLFLQIKQL